MFQLGIARMLFSCSSLDLRVAIVNRALKAIGKPLIMWKITVYQRGLDTTVINPFGDIFPLQVRINRLCFKRANLVSFLC
jgi:hypothetical protein